jgi:hypothetical protein
MAEHGAAILLRKAEQRHLILAHMEMSVDDHLLSHIRKRHQVASGHGDLISDAPDVDGHPFGGARHQFPAHPPDHDRSPMSPRSALDWR